MPVELDVSDGRAVEEFVAGVIEPEEPIDILVADAAVMQAKCDAVDLTDEELDRVMDVNFKGVANCCRSVGRWMRVRGSGRIITVGSQVAVAPWRGMSAYVASKGAVVAYTRALAMELVEHDTMSS